MRQLAQHEVPLVRMLLELGKRTEDPQELLVCPMDDGGMGSLRIGSPSAKRRFGGCIATVQFTDEDGTPVFAVLNVDTGKALYEVDVWKVDYSALTRWPSSEDLQVVSTSPPNSEAP